MLRGQTTGFEHGIETVVGGYQVTFEIDPLRFLDDHFRHMAAVEMGGHAEEGVHGAIGIRGHEHQAFSGMARGVHALHCVAVDTVVLEILDIETAGDVLGHAAGEIGFAAELGDGDHAVGRTAATGHLLMAVAEVFLQVQLSLLVDQRHHALAYAEGAHDRRFHVVFDIDQCIAERVYIVFFHYLLLYIQKVGESS